MEMLEEFFGSIYCWFETFFTHNIAANDNLANYLWGEELFVKHGQNLYLGVGLIMCTVTLLIVVAYYYLVNNAKLNHWWGWGLFFLANGFVNLVIGWQWTYTDLMAGYMKITDAASGQVIDSEINGTNCFCFGISNMLLSLMLFFLLSMLIKWKSSNVSEAPFVK